MFAFFRAYQKLIFICVTAIIIITFSFFGTYGTLDGSSNKKQKDKIISKTVNGKIIKQSEVEELAYFISRESEISLRLNLLNGGVLQSDFFQTKLAKVLFEKYYDICSSHLNKNFYKIKNFSSYVHPTVSFISAAHVWNQFNPEIVKYLEKIQQKEDVDLEAFDFLLELYVNQMKFPSDMLRKVLLYQQSQYQGIAIDRGIMNESLDLFGFSTVSDWFGQDFIDLIAQVILNVADLAETEGYKVSYEEARVDLMKKAYENFSKIVKNSDNTDDNDYFKYQLNLLGLSEKKLVNIWQKVVLFRKYFNNVGKSVFLDTLCYDEINSYNNEKAKIVLYELPSYLRFKNFEDFLKLQVYLKAVYNFKKDEIGNLKDLSEIAQKYPELIEQKTELKFKHVSLKDVSLKIGEKQLWEWQLEDENWNSLQEEFSFLQIFDQDKEKRFGYLETLKDDLRTKVDLFSRKKIIKDANLIRKALDQASEESLSIGMKKGVTKPVLQGVNNQSLYKVMEEELLKNSQIKESDSKLFCYTDNNEDFYQITIISQADEKNLVSYEDAVSEEILDQLLERTTKEKYAKLSEKEKVKIKDEQGQLKPYHEVKNQLGSFVFQEVLDKIDEQKKKKGIKDFSLDSYATYYFYFYMNKAKELLQKGESVTYFFPWDLVKKEEVVTKKFSNNWLINQLFSKKEIAKWSEVHVQENGKPVFFNFLNKETDKKASFEEIKKAQRNLGNEAKKSILKKIMDDLNQKKIIKLPLADRKSDNV